MSVPPRHKKENPSVLNVFLLSWRTQNIHHLGFSLLEIKNEYKTKLSKDMETIL